MGFLSNFFGNTFTPTYAVEQLPNGRFGIVSATGEIINSYTRKRDAFRGAERAGLNLDGIRD